MKNRVRQIDAASRGRNVTMKEFHLLSNGIEQVFAMFDAKVAELEFRIRALEPKTAGARFDANGKVITDDVPQTTAPAEVPDRGGFVMPSADSDDIC